MKTKRDSKLVVKMQKTGFIEIKPYGLAAGLEPHRPVLIFKSEDEVHSLGVPLSPLEAGISVSQNSHLGAGASPHGLSLEVFKRFQIQVKACFFKEIKSKNMFLEVLFSDSHEKEFRHVVRADEGLSFGLRAGAPFFVTKEFIAESKTLQSVESGRPSVSINNYKHWDKKPPYLM